MGPRGQGEDENGQPEEDEKLFGKFPGLRAGIRHTRDRRGFRPARNSLAHIDPSSKAALSGGRFTLEKGRNRASYSRAKSM